MKLFREPLLENKDIDSAEDAVDGDSEANKGRNSS